MSDAFTERKVLAPGAFTTVRACTTKLKRKNFATSIQSPGLQTLSPFFAVVTEIVVLKYILGVDAGDVVNPVGGSVGNEPVVEK